MYTFSIIRVINNNCESKLKGYSCATNYLYNKTNIFMCIWIYFHF